MIESLPGFFDLLKLSFAQYKANWTFYIKILVRGFLYGILLAGLPGILAVASIFFLPRPTSFIVFAVLIVITIIGSIFAQVWQILAMSKTAIEVSGGATPLKSADVFKSVRPLVFGYFLVMILQSFASFSGYLLFIIPGVIMSIWFSLAIYTYLIDQKKGVSALILSRDYVKGYTGGVFLYFFFWGIISYGLLSFLPSYIFEKLDMDLLGGLVSLVITPVIIPLSTIFVLNIYLALKKIKGQINVEYSSERKAKYFIAALMPLVAISILAAWTISIMPKLYNMFLQSPAMEEKFMDYDEWSEPTELDTLS